jgi:transcriptional regulator with XRE-family HTH domain
VSTGNSGQLAAFLRSRRARLTPADVGLPGDSEPGRRQTPGLRREEVAELSGVGVTWYTWLEQGRRIPASPQVIDALARALRLSGDEHRHLRELAGLTAPPPPAGDDARPRAAADWWAEYPVRYFRPARIRLRHPQAGLITLEMFQLRLEDDPGLLMVIQVPADAGSRDRMEALLAG